MFVCNYKDYIFVIQVISLYKHNDFSHKVLEGVAALGSALSTISAPPAKVVSSWLTDQVNPAYWTPNHLCTVRDDGGSVIFVCFEFCCTLVYNPLS